MRIGLLADTHLPASVPDLDQLGSTAAEFLASVDLILHAGDVILPSVLDWCAQFAPVLCSGGGHDHFHDDRKSPVVIVEHVGWRIGMVHDVEAIPPTINTVEQLKDVVYRDRDLDILVAGDSHYERLVYRDGTVLMDPGSPIFPHHKSTRLGSMGLIELTADGVHAEIVVLGHSDGAPNPCTPARLDLDRAGFIGFEVNGAAVEVEPGGHPGFRPRMAPPLRV